MRALGEVNEVKNILEVALGPILRRAARATLQCNVLPDGTPDIDRMLERLTEVARSRAGKKAFGLTTNASLLAGVFKRMLIKRGHLEQAPDRLLPPNWLADSAGLIGTWFRSLPGFLAPEDDAQLYNFVQGVWNALDEKGATRAEKYRAHAAKRQRDEGSLATMKAMMENFIKPCMEVLRQHAVPHPQPPHPQPPHEVNPPEQPQRVKQPHPRPAHARRA